MTILGLDLSTKTGYALLGDSGKLVTFGYVRSKENSQPYSKDYTYLDNAQQIADGIYKVILGMATPPDAIYIEQTNAGSFRSSQKQLEFIHFAVLKSLYHMRAKVHYVDTSMWRSFLGIRLNKDQKKHNKLAGEKKRSGKVNKKGEGKITTKHLAVNWANSTFGLELKLCENDIADACAVAKFGLSHQNKLVSLDQSNIEDKINKEFPAK